MGQDDLLDDGQAEAAAARRACAALVRAVEAVEDALGVFGLEAGAAIDDRQLEMAVGEDARADFDGADEGVENGVLEEIDEGLFHQPRVQAPRQPGGHVGLDGDAGVAGPFAAAGDGFVDDRGDRHGRARDLADHLGLVLEPSQPQQVVDDAQDAPRGVLDGAQRAVAEFRFGVGVGQEGLGVAEDQGQRGFEFVGDVGGVFLAGALELAHAGNVAQDEHDVAAGRSAFLVEGNARGLAQRAVATQLEFGGTERGRGADVAGESGQGFAVGQIGQGTADERRAVFAQQPVGRDVRAQDAVAGVEHQGAVLEQVEEGVEVVALLGDPAGGEGGVLHGPAFEELVGAGRRRAGFGLGPHEAADAAEQ